jgi:hypothetical protein
MFLFGDVCTTKKECRDLARLIVKGLKFRSVRESKRAYLHMTDEGYDADILAIALIGHRGSVMIATEVLDQEAHDKFDGLRRVTQITGIGKEILGRTVRWSLDGLSAREIIKRLRSV